MEEITLYKLIPSPYTNKSCFIYSLEHESLENITYAYDCQNLELITLDDNCNFEEVKGYLKAHVSNENILLPIQYPGYVYIFENEHECIILFNISNNKYITNDEIIYDIDKYQNGKLYECKIPVKFCSKGENKLYEKNMNEICPLTLRELNFVVQALIGRIYQIYPVISPTELTWYGEKISLLKWNEYENLKNENKISSSQIEHLLQPFAGSHRNNNRMILVKSNDGKKYFCQVKHDPKTNTFSNPIP